MFSRLFIGCQTREGNLEEFFLYENQSFLPSLSQNGTLRPDNKSDLLKCLEKVHPLSSEVPATDAVILDGAAVVNVVQPRGCKTFQDYAENCFIPYLQTEVRNAKRLDIVRDIYLPNSLKSATRKKRGTEKRRRVEGSTQISVKWGSFLRNDKNKSELFHFLSDLIHKNFRPAGKTVVATVDDHVLSFPDRNNEFLQPCNHEEADTRMFVHVNDAITQDNFRSVLIRLVDTDVVVLAVNAEYRFNVEIFVAFGTGNSFRCIEAHQLGPDKCVAILLFHNVFLFW